MKIKTNKTKAKYNNNNILVAFIHVVIGAVDEYQRLSLEKLEPGHHVELMELLLFGFAINHRLLQLILKREEARLIHVDVDGVLDQPLTQHFNVLF